MEGWEERGGCGGGEERDGCGGGEERDGCGGGEERSYVPFALWPSDSLTLPPAKAELSSAHTTPYAGDETPPSPPPAPVEASLQSLAVVSPVKG